MKKSKVILYAIVVLAVVGGALAFKAKSYGAVVFTGTNGICTQPVDDYATTYACATLINVSTTACYANCPLSCTTILP